MPLSWKSGCFSFKKWEQNFFSFLKFSCKNPKEQRSEQENGEFVPFFSVFSAKMCELFPWTLLLIIKEWFISKLEYLICPEVRMRSYTVYLFFQFESEFIQGSNIYNKLIHGFKIYLTWFV